MESTAQTTTAAIQSADATGTAAVPPRARKWLSSVFNTVAKVGLGAAVGLGVKTAVLATAATAATPVVGVVALAAFAGGLGSLAASRIKHGYENIQRRKQGQETVAYNWKKNGLLAFALGALGGGVASYFSDSLSSAVSSVSEYFKGVRETATALASPEAADVSAPDAPAATPAAPVAAAAPETPAPVAESAVPVGACLASDVQGLVNAEGASDAVRDAAARACSGNAATAAQGVKDLGYHAYNGVGMAKSESAGWALLNKAADAGNVQAIRDTAYIQFNGNAAIGVEADQINAAVKMESVADTDKTGLARRLLDGWQGGNPGDTPDLTTRLNNLPIREGGIDGPVPLSKVLEDFDAGRKVPGVTIPADEAPAAPAAPAAAEPAASSRAVVPAANNPLALDEGETVEGATTTTAPASPAAAAPVAAAVQTAPCKAVFESDKIEFHCDINDTTMVVGDRIQVIRPALLGLR